MSVVVFNTTINVDSSSIGGYLTATGLAQSFTVPSGGPYDLTTITLPLRRNAGVDDLGTIAVELYDVDVDGFPTGSVLSTGSID